MAATDDAPLTQERQKPASGSPQRIVLGFLILAIALGFIWSAFSIHGYTAYKRAVLESSRGKLIALTSSAAQSIDSLLRETIEAVQSVASGLSDYTLTKETALDRLRSALAAHDHFHGITITCQRFAFDPKRRLYSNYYFKKNAKIEFSQLDSVYDDTKSEYDWFGPALQGALWTQPYYDDAAHTFMVTYSAPFYGRRTSSSGERVPMVSSRWTCRWTRSGTSSRAWIVMKLA